MGNVEKEARSQPSSRLYGFVFSVRRSSHPPQPIPSPFILGMQEQPNVTEFQSKVYHLCRQIPAGSFSTYKAISTVLHASPRAVGGALRRNPFAPEVPCHRVISSQFTLGGFQGDSKPGCLTLKKKLAMLTEEGLHFDDQPKVIKEHQESRYFSTFIPQSA